MLQINPLNDIPELKSYKGNMQKILNQLKKHQRPQQTIFCFKGKWDYVADQT